jgi:NADH:ubiquinone oxidoreductase subunit 6 (subunit J)
VFNELQALLLSGALISACAFALFSPKVSGSLIALFYGSFSLGLIFVLFGDSLLGLLQMATFAGAVSVLMLTVILLTGESTLNLGARKGVLVLAVPLLLFVAVALLLVTGLGGPENPNSYQDISSGVLLFVWQQRPWDLLILVMAFASAMVTITNLFSRES